MAQLLVALDEARALLTDVAATLWTNTASLPFAKKAHREMQLDLLTSGLPVIKEVLTDQTVLANATTLPAPPTDIVEPIDMAEKTPNTSEQYVPTYERMWAPDEERASTLRYWAWREEAVELLGATVDRLVRLRYWKGITTPTAETSPIGLILGETYIGPKTAALAAMSVGNNSLMELWQRDSEVIIDKIVRFNIRGQQAMPVRRRPYRPRRIH